MNSVSGNWVRFFAVCLAKDKTKVVPADKSGASNVNKRE